MLPKRKHPRLKDWDYNTEACYFLTLCTKSHKPILSRIVGRSILDAPERIHRSQETGSLRFDEESLFAVLGTICTFLEDYFDYVYPNSSESTIFWFFGFLP